LYKKASEMYYDKMSFVNKNMNKLYKKNIVVHYQGSFNPRVLQLEAQNESMRPNFI